MLGSSRYLRKAPYIYSDQEIAALCATSLGIRPRYGLRPHTYATLFGWLACTGLRVSEALALNDADVDLKAGLLTVRWSKFNRSRLIPLHPSTLNALREYRQFRDRQLPANTTGSFLVNEEGTRLAYHHVRHQFDRLRSKLGWTAVGRTRKPRIHDLRHTFAVRCILRWYREQANVDQKIAVLATYLGHVNVTWYLTAVPELLAVVSERFERFSDPQIGGMK